MQGLVRSNGISHWSVYDREMNAITKDSESTKSSWFEPTDAEKENFNLEHCMRVYPHQQNTGGFFIAVFEKTEDFSEDQSTADKEVSRSPTAPQPGRESLKDTNPKKKAKLPIDAIDEPFVFIDPNHEAVKGCWDYYGIDDKFDKNSCLVRNATGEPTRVIYTTSPHLKSIIQSNDDKLKIIYSGVKLAFCLSKR